MRSEVRPLTVEETGPHFNHHVWVRRQVGFGWVGFGQGGLGGVSGWITELHQIVK